MLRRFGVSPVETVGKEYIVLERSGTGGRGQSDKSLKPVVTLVLSLATKMGPSRLILSSIGKDSWTGPLEGVEYPCVLGQM